MGSFFKACGRGILYVLGLPLFLVVIALYSVVGLVIFIYVFIKWAILFFSGRSLDHDLEEDIEVKKIIEDLKTQPSQTSNVTPEVLTNPQVIEVINVEQKVVDTNIENNDAGPTLIDVPEIKETKDE